MIFYRAGDKFYSSLVVAKKETLARLAPREITQIMKCNTGDMPAKALMLAALNKKAPWDEEPAATVKGRNRKSEAEKNLGPITKDTPDDQVEWTYGKKGAEMHRVGTNDPEKVLRDW